MNKVDNPVP